MALTSGAEFGKLHLPAKLCVTVFPTIQNTSSPLSGAERPPGHMTLQAQRHGKRWAFLCPGVAISPRQTIDRTAPQKGKIAIRKTAGALEMAKTGADRLHTLQFWGVTDKRATWCPEMGRQDKRSPAIRYPIIPQSIRGAIARLLGPHR